MFSPFSSTRYTTSDTLSSSNTSAITTFYSEYYTNESIEYLIDSIIKVYFTNDRSYLDQAVTLLLDSIHENKISPQNFNKLTNKHKFNSAEERKQFGKTKQIVYPYFWYTLNKFCSFSVVCKFISFINVDINYNYLLYRQCLINNSEKIIAAIFKYQTDTSKYDVVHCTQLLEKFNSQN